MAGTIEGFHALLSFRCRTSDESCRQLYPASHTTALGGLFIADVRGGMQERNLRSAMFTSLVPTPGWSRGDADRAARSDGQECPSPHEHFPRPLLWEFQGYELGWFCACVGYGVGILAGEPFAVAGFEVAGHGAHAFHVAADFEIGDGYQQVRAFVVIHGDCGAGLEFEFGGADSVFYEEDLLGASRESFEGAVFVPMGGRLAEGFVVCDFYGHVAEGLVGSVAGYVGEGGGRETRVAVLEFDGGGRFVLDLVDYFGCAQSYVDVVVAVPVHERVGVGRDFDVVDADVFVFER